MVLLCVCVWVGGGLGGWGSFSGGGGGGDICRSKCCPRPLWWKELHPRRMLLLPLLLFYPHTLLLLRK